MSRFTDLFQSKPVLTKMVDKNTVVPKNVTSVEEIVVDKEVVLKTINLPSETNKLKIKRSK